MCDGWRDDRCDEREEGTRDEERQMDHHDIIRECVCVCISFFHLLHSYVCLLGSDNCIIRAYYRDYHYRHSHRPVLAFND